MFMLMPEMKKISATAEQCCGLWQSSNRVVLAVPGMEAQSAQAFVVAARNSRGLIGCHVYVLLTRTATPVVYVGDQPPVVDSQFESLKQDALAFVESMGFFLDDLRIQTLSPAQRATLWQTMPFLTDTPKVAEDVNETLTLDEVAGEEVTAGNLLAGLDAMSEPQKLAWARFLSSF